MNDSDSTLPRRDFIKKTAAATAVAAVAGSRLTGAHHAGSDKIRIALIGAGGKGSHDAEVALQAAEGIELVALADLFEDKVASCHKRLKEKLGEDVYKKKVKVTPETTFYGLDAYKKVLAMDTVDLVMLATPPGFRPQMLRESILAGKHVFAEKPAAVDVAGIHSVLESTKMAKERNLTLVPGTQQRWMPQYIETVKRIQDGQIGPVTGAKAYWVGHMQNWHYHDRKPEWSDLEWQIRCWNLFTWLSGDCIVEQCMHQVDTTNWGLDAVPVSCQALGGRASREGDKYGNVYDHFSVEFEYPNGVTVTAKSAQILNLNRRVNNHFIGPDGRAVVSRGNAEIKGRKPWKYSGELDGTTPMFADMFDSMRRNEPINLGKQFAESTLTCIMGRMSAYTGRIISWDWLMARSKLDLHPAELAFDQPLPFDPVPVPGQTKLV